MMKFDDFFENSSRRVAAVTSRRSFIGYLGKVVAVGAALPLLPVGRDNSAYAQTGDGAQAGSEDWNDPGKCAYWANCGVDGFLCSAVGGTSTSCPPGSEGSPIAWIGTCLNPGDGKSYVVTYNDCCGLQSGDNGFCNRNDGETPRYRPQRSNAVTWCYGGVSSTYHCTVARVTALAEAGAR